MLARAIAILLSSTTLSCSPGTGSPAPVILGRNAASMTYDPVSHRVLLFGGRGPDVAGGPVEEHRDLWSFDLRRWTRIADGTGGPSNRNGAGLVFDVARGRAVLYGGRLGENADSPAFDETWEWNGSAWSQGTGAMPGVRMHFAMTYDLFRSRSVIFGGFNPATFTDRADLWERSDAAWTQVTITPPTELFAPVMVYDPKAKVTWLFVNDPTTKALQTYSWNGTTLQRVNTAGPALMRYGAAAEGPTTGGVILFGGGSGNSLSSDTWRWNGTTWTKLSPLIHPSARGGQVMAYDSDRNRAILFGGVDAAGSYLADTWEWNGSDWTQLPVILE